MNLFNSSGESQSKKSKDSSSVLNYYGIVLDESGSMNSTKKDTIGSLQSFHDEQQADFHKGSPFIIHTFSNDVRCPYEKTLNHSLSSLKYKPSGSTALHDAIKTSIKQAENYISDMSQKPEGIFIIILTDGEENSSKDCTLDEITKLISKHKELGWQFIYLGANQDAILTGREMGLERGQCLSFNQSTKAQYSAMRSVSSAVKRHVISSESQAVEFNDDERNESIQPF